MPEALPFLPNPNKPNGNEKRPGSNKCDVVCHKGAVIPIAPAKTAGNARRRERDPREQARPKFRLLRIFRIRL